MVDFTSNFDSDEEGFVYQDDVFGTNRPAYADGEHIASGGFTGGALRIVLGNVDDSNIYNGMSGGWQRSFTVDSQSTGTLTFRYNMSHLVRYDSNEYTEVRVAVDGIELPVVDHLDGGIYQDSTGWQTVELDLGSLSAGNHTLTIGGFNNRKTKSTEAGEILIDDVELTTVATAPVQLFDDADNFVAGFNTLEDAIAASSADYRIEIISTTLSTAGQVVIPHDLTINGAGQDQTVVQASANTGTGGDARGWFLVPEGVNLDMSGLTLDGNGFNIYQGIRHRGSGTFDDVQFLDIAFQPVGGGSPYQGTGIAVFGDASNVDVTNSSFQGIGRIGVLYFGPGVTGTFENNSYTGKGAGDHLDYALDISNGAVIQVLNNTVSENRGVASSDGSTSAAFLVSTFFGPGTEATFVGNNLDNNTTGVAVGFNLDDTSTVTFGAGNTITNSEFGVNVNGNATVNNPENVTGDSARFDYDGGDANNSFSGAAEGDDIDGGTGIDTLIGNPGDDTYRVDDSSDVVIEQLNEGTDHVFSAVTYLLPDNVENLTLLNVTEAPLDSYATGFEAGEGFSLGSIDGQQGWFVNSAKPEGIVDSGGPQGQAFLIANDPSSGDFAGPYGPALSVSAGEPGTTADDRFMSMSYKFKPMSSTPDGSRVEIDFGNAGATDRVNFMALEFTEVKGLRLVVSEPTDLSGTTEWTNDSGQPFNFDWETGNRELASDIDPTVWHEVKLELNYFGGPDNDVIDVFLDGVHIGQTTTFENYFDFHVAANPHNVNAEAYRSNRIFFRNGEAAGNDFDQDGAGGDRAGFLIDDVSYSVGGDVLGLGAFGNDLANTITGNDGMNTMTGAAGDDVIFGMAGNDVIRGDEDDDTLDGGRDFDSAVFSGNVAEYTITLQLDGSLQVADNTLGRDGTDTLIDMESLIFADVTLSTGPVALYSSSGVFEGGFDTIQAAVDAASNSDRVLVAPGTYNENVSIVNKNITLRSIGGREVTTIEGFEDSVQGTIFLDGVTDQVQIGGEGQGFTVIGFDGPTPAIERGAFYARANAAPGHTNLSIVGNEFVAKGDSAMTFEFNNFFDGVQIRDNVFSGTTFDPSQPIGDPTTFGGQFSTENVARQLVVIGSGGSTGTGGNVNTRNIVFTENEITGTAGGVVKAGETYSDGGTPTVATEDIPFGNTMVTIDAVGAEIFSNHFTGTTMGPFGGGLRARGPSTDINENHFDNTAGGDTRGVFQTQFDGFYFGNSFTGSEGSDLFSGSAGDDQMTGNGGKDVLGGNFGDDTIDGGADIDTAVYQGFASDYAVVFGGGTSETTLINANFDAGADGFTYSDDVFGTNRPIYADGEHIASGGFTGGALRVQVGGVNNNNIYNGMSGGWSQSFNVASEAEGTLTFRYNMSHLVRYDSNEYTEVRVAVDGVELPVVDHLDGGVYQDSTGWQTVELDLGTLSAGNHTLTIGAFNNRKTKSTETGEVLIDDVELKTTSAGTDTMVTDTNTADGDEGTDTLIDVENLFFAAEGPVQVFDGSNQFVAGYTSIQGAIDDVTTLDGFKVVIQPGTYSESIVVDKQLTIAGIGPVVLNGDGLGSANGITIAADNVTIDPLTVTNFGGHGIIIDDLVSNIILDGVISTRNTNNGLELHNSAIVQNLVIQNSSFSANENVGLRVASSGQIAGLTVMDSHFDNNEYGWYVANDGSTSLVTDVTVTNTTFDGDFDAGIYAETMTNASFTGVTGINSGIGSANGVVFDFTAFYDNTELSNISFDDFTIRNTTGDPVFAGFRFESFEAASAGFGDSPPLENISISNGTIDGVDRAIRVNAPPGEFTQSNVTLENIGIFESWQRGGDGQDILTGDLFSGNDRDFLQGDATFFPGGDDDTLNGGGGNDVLEGGPGDDSLIGGDGLDTAVFSREGSDYSVIFGLDGLPQSVTQVVEPTLVGSDGVDTLSGVENLFFLGENRIQVFDDNGSFVESYVTIQEAVDDATTLDGYKVMLGGGTYNESVTVDKALSFVGAGNGHTILTPNSGSAFVLSGDLGAGNSVGFHNLRFLEAPRSGIQLGTGVTLGALLISDSHFEANTFNGVEVVNGEGLDNFELTNSTFYANGQPASSSGDGDVLLFNYEGDALIRDVMITGADRGTGPAENGIQFRSDGNGGARGPLGNVALENVTIDGLYEKQPIAVFNYDNVDGLTMTNVEVTADSTAFNLALNFDGIAGDIDASGYDVAFGPDPMALQGDGDANALTGTDGNEILNGFDGDDTLIGNGGEDVLRGGPGSDVMTGGADADTFLLASGDGAPNLALADVITDYVDGVDSFGLAGLGVDDVEISTSGGDAVIAAGAEVLAVVTGAAGQLDADDFTVVVA